MSLKCKSVNNSKDSLSIDSYLFDGSEYTDQDQEQSFIQINNDKSIQSKESLSNSIDSNLNEKILIKFHPKVVYKKCFELRKVGEKSNLTYKFVKNEVKLIRKILDGHGFEQVHSSSSLFNLMWTSSPIKPSTFKTLYPFQRVNHFPKSYELTRKDRLYKNIEKIQQEKGLKYFDFIPTTFVLPQQLNQFKTTFEREKGIWIIKPIASSQGRGIYLINNSEQVPRDGNIVVSRYIDNPLLIDGYKFDIRLYVAVTSYDPLVIYLYREGLARFATVKYDRNLVNLSNRFMHLTNYSLNKQNHRYIRCDDPEIEDYGNKWTLSAMLRLLKSEGKDTFTLMMSIEDLIIKTFISVEHQISNACQIFLPNKSNCFEVYGFDILVDDQLKPWLIEVNLSPSLTCDAPIDLKIKSHMICDLLNLVSIPCLNPYKYLHKQYQLSNSQSQTNKRSRSITVNTSSTNENVEKEYFGLSFDQIRIIKKVEEESLNSGGFIRIFPSEDSYEFFSNFFEERKICLNKMVHQYLYPSRWNKLNINNQENLKEIRRNNIPRFKHLSSSFHLFNKNNLNQSNLSNLQQAIQRYQIYQQRIPNCIYPNQINIIHPHKIVIEQTISGYSDLENSSILSNSLLISDQKRRATPFHSRRRLLSTNRKQYETSKSNPSLNLVDHSNAEQILFQSLTENEFKQRLYRVSSAPKREHQQKSNEISSIDRSSRPISTIVIHRKRMSTRLSCSSSSTKRMVTDTETNVSTNEELNVDFVERLNELSSKQHHRQYSHVSHISSLVNEEKVNEEKVNSDEKEKTEEKLLEKSRQILEENQIRNEQLAKQAKMFQQKMRKSEIYSALNRYSHRPPVYPASSDKSQRLKKSRKVSIFADQHRIKSTL